MNSTGNGTIQSPQHNNYKYAKLERLLFYSPLVVIFLFFMPLALCNLNLFTYLPKKIF